METLRCDRFMLVTYDASMATAFMLLVCTYSGYWVYRHVMMTKSESRTFY